jgi:hypothetical protein
MATAQATSPAPQSGQHLTVGNRGFQIGFGSEPAEELELHAPVLMLYAQDVLSSVNRMIRIDAPQEHIESLTAAAECLLGLALAMNHRVSEIEEARP